MEGEIQPALKPRKINIKLFIIIGIILIVLAAGVIFSLKYFGKDKDDNNKKQPEIPVRTPIDEQLKDKTELSQKGYTFSDISISSSGATNIITGSFVSENDADKVNLELKLYNSTTKRMLGESSAIIEDIVKGEKKTFEISIIGDYSTVDEFKVIVGD